MHAGPGVKVSPGRDTSLTEINRVRSRCSPLVNEEFPSWCLATRQKRLNTAVGVSPESWTRCFIHRVRGGRLISTAGKPGEKEEAWRAVRLISSARFFQFNFLYDRVK